MYGSAGYLVDYVVGYSLKTLYRFALTRLILPETSPPGLPRDIELLRLLVEPPGRPPLDLIQPMFVPGPASCVSRNDRLLTRTFVDQPPPEKYFTQPRNLPGPRKPEPSAANHPAAPHGNPIFLTAGKVPAKHNP